MTQSTDDIRFFQSSGPFDLAPGQSQTIVVAYMGAAPVDLPAIRNRSGSFDLKPGWPAQADSLRLGDTLLASVPENAFPLVDKARSYIFIAGGIGITPILSMIRSFGELPPAPWKLYYLSREAETTAFLDVLKDPALRRNVVVHHSGGDGSNS